MTRDEVQKQALEAFLSSDRRASIILTTGTGKTKVGVDIYSSLAPVGETLILCPKTALVPQWEETFKKFGIPKNNVRITTLQSEYKKDQEVEFLIIDEVHRALSPAYKQVFESIKYKHLLCLTATVPRDDEKKALLNYYAPIIYSKTLEQTKEFEFTPDFTIYNLVVKMDKVSEKGHYVYNKMFSEASQKLASVAKREGMTIFDFAKKNKDDQQSAYQSLSRSYWFGMTKRRASLHDNTAKIPIVKQVIATNPNKKWLIFVHTEVYAKKLAASLPDSIVYSYKLPTAEKTKIVEAFKAKKFKYLIGINALNEGFDDPEIYGAICVSGNSSEIVNTQQVGRILRLSKDKKVFVNIFAAGTVEESWMRKKLKDIESTTISSVNEIR